MRRIFAVARLQRPLTTRQFASAGWWKNVEMGPKDPILGVAENFKADKDPRKVNVGIGAYRDDDGKPWILPSVATAVQRIHDSKADNEYPPISGVPEFVQEATWLAYGKDSDAVKNKRVAAVQSLSGTGALRLAGHFFERFPLSGKTKPTVYVTDPTWSNHFNIFGQCHLEVKTYRYWNAKTLGIDMEGLLEDLKKAPEKSVILLHACAHNPTGIDPTPEQWTAISKVCKERNHFVCFDLAYQGFASGDVAVDARAVNQFIKDGHLIALCQSFAKNFGLYGQRTGLFSVLCADADEAARVESQIKIIARAIWSNPPLHGARIIATVLADPNLRKMWQGELKLMSGRITQMRQMLKDNLKKAGSTRNWDHITTQIGMFSYTGLTPEQCDKITKDHHVYLTRNGRISMAGVNSKNVAYLANAMHAVTK